MIWKNKSNRRWQIYYLILTSVLDVSFFTMFMVGIAASIISGHANRLIISLFGLISLIIGIIILYRLYQHYKHNIIIYVDILDNRFTLTYNDNRRLTIDYDSIVELNEEGSHFIKTDMNIEPSFNINDGLMNHGLIDDEIMRALYKSIKQYKDE